jgi:4-amino-4-deoxy-L-arabinose transferase-like glycosyltransferase
VAVVSRLHGSITPFISRLPSALAALGCVLLTLSLGTKLLGRRAGVLAGFVLCTNYAFAWEARQCMVDMLFTFFVTLALYFCRLGFDAVGPRRRFFILAYVAAGLAALTKGPLGVVFPSLVVIAFLAWGRKLKLLRAMRIPWGILIVAGIQAAWYVPYLLRIGPGGRRFFWEMYVYKENLLRFASGFDKAQPFWFYVPELLSHFLPWSVFLVLWPLLPRTNRDAEPARDISFPWAWFLSLFAFLTASSGKHSRYALPLYPAAALLVGDFWDRLMGGESPRLARFIMVIVVVLAVGCAAGLPVFAHQIAPEIFRGVIIASALLLALAIVSVRPAAPARLPTSFAVIVLGFALGWCIFIMNFPLHEARRAEQQRLAAEVAPLVGTHRLATYGPTDERFGRRLALGFFINRPVIFIDREGDLLDYLRSEQLVYCLMQSSVYGGIRPRLKDPIPPAGPFRYKDLDLVLIANR